MGRVNQESAKKLTAFINSLPAEARGKCALCNETLVHIVKQAEAQTGAGTATVTKALADKINETAAPLDKVVAENLRAKIKYNEVDVESIRRNYPNRNEDKKPEPKKQKEAKTKYVDESTEAMQFAVIAINQLNRIRKEDPKKIEALNRVKIWVNNKLQE